MSWLQHWLVERLFDRTPMVTTHLRATIFMHWLENFWIRTGADEGLLRLPVGDASFAPINTLDAARVAVAVLQNPDAHDRQRYDLFGAEELDWHQIAGKVASATLGSPVRVRISGNPEMIAAPAPLAESPAGLVHITTTPTSPKTSATASSREMNEAS